MGSEKLVAGLCLCRAAPFRRKPQAQFIWVRQCRQCRHLVRACSTCLIKTTTESLREPNLTRPSKAKLLRRGLLIAQFSASFFLYNCRSFWLCAQPGYFLLVRSVARL